MGWLHFDPQQKKFVAVRHAKCGGTRSISTKLNSNAQDLIRMGRAVFFPNDNSFFGNFTEMKASIGNFKCEEIMTKTTLAKYISANALTSVRLYLMT